MKKHKQREKLPAALKLSLFCTSYAPLFAIIVIKQLLENADYLSFGGINMPAITNFVQKFGVSITLSVLIIFGLGGMYMFVSNMKELTENNGHKFVVRKIQNKNNESIGYVATYLVPFMFQSFSSPFEIMSFSVLLIVVYIIYTHSTLIIVNPLLNLKYSLFDIEFTDLKSGEDAQATFIADCHYVEKGDVLISKSLGSNLYFSILEDCDERVK